MRGLTSLVLTGLLAGVSAPAFAAISPDGSLIVPGQGGSLTTSDGTWTFEAQVSGSNTPIDLNGAQAGNGRATMLEVYGAKMYAEADDSSWWLWTGFGWNSVPAPPITIGKAILYWTNPTTNEDNTAIPATGQGALATTTLEYGVCTITGAFGTKQGQITVAAPAALATVNMTVAQEYCFRAAAVNNLGGTSIWSNVATKINTPLAPAQPTNLHVGANLTAYVIGQNSNRVTMVPVGTVAAGTACDSKYSVMGMNVVPQASVSFASPSDAVVVFAKCL